MAALSVAPSPSVSPAIHPATPIVSKQESRRNFEFSGNVTMDRSKFEV